MMLIDTSSQRIAELHREIELRDRKLEELEAQLAIKDSIIKKQGALLAEMQAKQLVWHRADEKPNKPGRYLCAIAYDIDANKKAPYEYFPVPYSCEYWFLGPNINKKIIAWAEFPPYEVKKND